MSRYRSFMIATRINTRGATLKKASENFTLCVAVDIADESIGYCRDNGKYIKEVTADK